MSRSEARTSEAWRAFDLWATVIPLVLLVPAVFGWLRSGGASCCSEGALSAVVAPVTPPDAAPVATPAPAAAETRAPAPEPAAAPVVDCAKITEGVTVPFATSSATLTDAGKQALDATITCLNSGQYEVGGHTDSDGSATGNQRLSEARARAAVAYLVTKGVAEDRLRAKGFGETTPVADNTTADGKARNRRITFTTR